MGFKKIGIATCISFVDLARTLSGILESHGFEVASAACKNGGIPKELIGLRDEEKIRPGSHESMCNPISQAQLLNRAGCQLNIVLGLCVGHDSLFFRYSEGLAGQRPRRSYRRRDADRRSPGLHTRRSGGLYPLPAS